MSRGHTSGPGHIVYPWVGNILLTLSESMFSMPLYLFYLYILLPNQFTKILVTFYIKCFEMMNTLNKGDIKQRVLSKKHKGP